MNVPHVKKPGRGNKSVQDITFSARSLQEEHEILNIGRSASSEANVKRARKILAMFLEDP